MKNKCLICDEEFNSEESLKKHVDAHLNESILNKPVETSREIDTQFDIKNRTIDLKKIFSEEKFERLIESKINKIIDVQEIIKKRNFVDKVKIINRRNPFCYLPYFIRDFMSGTSTRKLEDKYHIWFFMDLYNVTQNILEFTEYRYLSKKYDNALELNLKNIDWDKKYQELQENCIFFKDELDELIFDNVLQADILLLLMDNQLEKDKIITRCKELKNHYDLFGFIDNELSNSFNKIIKIDLENRVSDIIFGLMKEDVFLRSRSEPKKIFVRFSIDKIKKIIINELKHGEKIIYSTLRSKIHNQFPGLRLIPGLGVFTTAWRELENEKIIHIEYRSYRLNDFVFFLNENFQEIYSAVKLIGSDQKIPFKGRKITPERFIDELLELETGDFGDDDDQVTRMAGLVLAESVKLQSPHEDIPEFDFTINLKNYNFRPEQLDAMSKLNFKINSEIFHIKVMINETLNLKKCEELRKKIPSNQQGVVITFEKIPYDVKKILENDPTIQIIDEEGVKIWVSITSRLPARVNSMCKISTDPLSKLENKIVKVNSVFYKTGIALVTVFPEMNEETILVRSLEEISLFEPSPSDFELFSKNYFEFIKILSKLTSKNDLVNGFFKNKFVDDATGSKIKFELKVADNTVKLNLDEYKTRRIFNCDCFKFIENPSQLCSHLVTALDHIVRSFSYLDQTWNNTNSLSRSLQLLIRENIGIILDRLEIGVEYGEITGDTRIADFVLGVAKTRKNF